MELPRFRARNYTKPPVDRLGKVGKAGIRVTPEQWKRVEKVAKERKVSANRHVVELAIEVFDRCGGPRTPLDIQVAKAALFAAQILRRDLIAAGRENEVEELLQFISALVPEAAKHIGERDRRTRFASSPSPGREYSLR